MQKIFVFLLVIGSVSVNFFSQEFKPVADGIEYAEIERGIDQTPVKMNLLRLDLTKVRLDVVHALDSAIGLEKTSSMAARHGALAAINAGFFRIDKSIFEGDDVGLLKIDNELYSESLNGRVALMIANKADRTSVFIERANISASVSIKDRDFEVGTNRERKKDDLVLFTERFGQTTLTDPDGIEFIIKNNKVIQILDRSGSSPIPCDGYVLSASGKMREQLLGLLKLKTKIKRIGTTHSSPTEQIPGTAYGQAEDIVSGVPQLIKNGKIEITWQEEKSSKSFVETKHPRTAVAKLKDGRFLLVTVDGRSESSGGIALQNLAELLFELGAVEAMNLDGGGSTTMFLNGKLVNHPSDKEGERKVSDAILVFPRQKN
jgi:hypothetical protein